MSGIGCLHGIHGEGADRVDAGQIHGLQQRAKWGRQLLRSLRIILSPPLSGGPLCTKQIQGGRFAARAQPSLAFDPVRLVVEASAIR